MHVFFFLGHTTQATAIPDFSVVLAFVGAVPSILMSFFLPALFHLVICWRVMGFWGRLCVYLYVVVCMSELHDCIICSANGVHLFVRIWCVYYMHALTHLCEAYVSLNKVSR